VETVKKPVDLFEWCEQYIRSRDAMERKLVKLERESHAVMATYKDRTIRWLPLPQLSVPKENEGNITIVCLQTQANFNVLVNDFAAFAKNPGLTVIFLNPALNEKWLLKPAIHHAVADKSTLKSGLQTLYQTVPPA
jgi:hypothetical protein